jgi:hypothetical protein
LGAPTGESTAGACAAHNPKVLELFRGACLFLKDLLGQGSPARVHPAFERLELQHAPVSVNRLAPARELQGAGRPPSSGAPSDIFLKWLHD